MGLAVVAVGVTASSVEPRPDGAGMRVVSLLVLLLCAAVICGLPEPQLVHQPQPDVSEYASAAANIASGRGYVARVDDPFAVKIGRGLVVPKYPPGYPIVLAAFPTRWRNYGAPKVVAILLLTGIYALAARLGGPLAGATAAVLFVVSPYSRGTAMTLMSDTFSALLTVITLLCVRRVPRVAGAVAGFAVLVRLSNVMVLVGTTAVARPGERTAVLRWSVPPLAMLAAYQWHTFGSPFATGYGSGSASFGLRFVTPLVLQGVGPGTANWVFYPALLLGILPIFLPPLVPVIAALEAWRRRNSADARFLAVLAGASLALYVPYFGRDPRFMAPTAMIETVFVGAFAGRVAHSAGTGRVPVGAG